MVLVFLRNEGGGHILEFFAGFIGFTVIIYQIFKSNSFFTTKMKFLYSFPYITGLWFFSAYHVNSLLAKFDGSMKHPLVIFGVVYLCIIVSMIVANPEEKIKLRPIQEYGE